MSSVEVCPHCQHAWQSHVRGRCACGCMWTHDDVHPPPPPPPPTPEQLRVQAVIDAIFDELDRQAEENVIDAPYWDREWGCLDGEPDWGAVAVAVLARLAQEPR